MEVRPGIDQEAEEQVKKRWWVPGSRYTWSLVEGRSVGRRWPDWEKMRLLKSSADRKVEESTRTSKTRRKRSKPQARGDQSKSQRKNRSTSKIWWSNRAAKRRLSGCWKKSEAIVISLKAWHGTDAAKISDGKSWGPATVSKANTFTEWRFRSAVEARGNRREIERAAGQ